MLKVNYKTMKNTKQEIPRINKEKWQNDYDYLFEGKKIEKEKDKIIFKMRFVRHSEKQITSGSETNLTKRGIFQGAILGTKRGKADSLTINYSPTPRTQATAETAAISGNSKTTIKENSTLGIKNDLSQKYLEELMSIKRKIRKKYPVELSSKQKKELDIEVGNAQIDSYLAHKQNKPDKGTLSPEKMGSKIKKIIKEQIDDIKNGEYENGSIHESLNITHDLVIASFLNQAIGNYGEYAIKPGEGFEIIIKNKNAGEAKDETELILFFRGKEYKLNYDELYK